MELATICCWNHLPELSEFDELSDVGRENRALVRFRENAQEISILKLAERVGHLRETLAPLAASAPSLVAIHQSSPEFTASGGGWRRVGFPERGFAKPTEINGFAIMCRERNDLAFAHFRRGLRPIAGFCRFFYFNDTRNGTRRERLPNPLAKSSDLDS